MKGKRLHPENVDPRVKVKVSVSTERFKSVDVHVGARSPARTLGLSQEKLGESVGLTFSKFRSTSAAQIVSGPVDCSRFPGFWMSPFPFFDDLSDELKTHAGRFADSTITGRTLSRSIPNGVGKPWNWCGLITRSPILPYASLLPARGAARLGAGIRLLLRGHRFAVQRRWKNA